MHHLELATHTREQPSELLLTEAHFAREELADTWLVHAAESRQFGLSGAGFQHHFTEQLTSIGHASSRAMHAIARACGETTDNDREVEPTTDREFHLASSL